MGNDRLGRIGSTVRHRYRVKADLDNRVTDGAGIRSEHVDADAFSSDPAMLVKLILGSTRVIGIAEEPLEQRPSRPGHDCVSET